MREESVRCKGAATSRASKPVVSLHCSGACLRTFVSIGESLVCSLLSRVHETQTESNREHRANPKEQQDRYTLAAFSAMAIFSRISGRSPFAICADHQGQPQWGN